MLYQEVLKSLSQAVCIALDGQLIFATSLDQNPSELLTFANPDTGEIYEFDLTDFDDALEDEESNLEEIAQKVLQAICTNSKLVIYKLEPVYTYENGTVKSHL